MIRQVRLDKFPKKCSAFRPQILNSITLIDRRPFDLNVFKLTAFDTNYQQQYQLYVSRKLNPQTSANLQFIQHTPNLLVLSNQPYSLVFEEHSHQTLKQYLAKRQAQTGLPFMSEVEAKELIFDILKPLASFDKNTLQCPCVNDHNILRFNHSWTLSLASALTNSFANDRNFYDPKQKPNQSLFYAIGTLLFKTLFGFVPFEENAKKPSQFNFATYIDHLQHQSIKKLLKIYYFAERIPFISNECKKFIQDTLSGKITSFQECKNHSFFTSPPESPKKQLIENKQIRMLNFFNQKHHSLIMASIDRRKKNPYQKLHPKMQTDIAGFLQLKQTFAKDPLLRHLVFEQVKTQSEINRQQEDYNNLKIDCKYFDNQFDFQQRQRPTLQLIKFIEKDKSKNPDLYQKFERQSAVKLYAFPYAMVFELANVYFEQPIDVKKKIQQLIPYLLEVSSMHGQIDRLTCLHYTKQKHTKFQEIKLKYRELVNQIYKHFLNEAMKRYNAKKQNLTITQKMRLKDQGLEYYRLCLKLMEVSLIVRKAGKDLDLQRIETSARKEIEQDLEVLLKTYFPNRVEIR